MVTGERIQGNRPPLRDKDLASYSTGLFNEEGYSYCKKRTGRRAGGPSRTIAITMCDRDALEPAARWWGLPVRQRGGRTVTCRDGPAFRIEASGLRAELILCEMTRYGLSRGKLVQWRKALRGCRNKKSSPRRHATRRKTSLRRDSFLKGDLLARYSTGLFNGGGCSTCAKSGRYVYPRITVTMCDRDALEPVGRWWGVNVRSRGGKMKVCTDGPAYRISTSGARAIIIVSEMMKYGLSNRKTEQWRKVLSQSRRAAQSVPR